MVWLKSWKKRIGVVFGGDRSVKGDKVERTGTVNWCSYCFGLLVVQLILWNPIDGGSFKRWNTDDVLKWKLWYYRTNLFMNLFKQV
jgi:hypothetical protein